MIPLLRAFFWSLLWDEAAAGRACRACARPVTEDGALGPQTLAVANGITPGVLLPAVRCEAASWYRLLVANGFPAKFLIGLLNRAYS
jgi:hypothetical protein